MSNIDWQFVENLRAENARLRQHVLDLQRLVLSLQEVQQEFQQVNRNREGVYDVDFVDKLAQDSGR